MVAMAAMAARAQVAEVEVDLVYRYTDSLLLITIRLLLTTKGLLLAAVAAVAVADIMRFRLKVALIITTVVVVVAALDLVGTASPAAQELT
jgi:threonine synthase